MGGGGRQPCRLPNDIRGSKQANNNDAHRWAFPTFQFFFFVFFFFPMINVVFRPCTAIVFT